MDKKAERLGRDKVLRSFARQLNPLGFSRTKPTIFTRVCPYWIEFGHIHKFSFGPYFRVHLGIRVIADIEGSLALNGLCSDEIPDWMYFLVDHRKYDFDYDDSPASIEECVKQLLRFWNKVAEPWFTKWQDPKRLLKSAKSPLSPAAKRALTDLLEGESCINSNEITNKLLGLS